MLLSSDIDVVGSARRRRERLLRCFLRHEEMAVRMALTRATHRVVQRHQCTQTVTLAATDAATLAPSPVIEYMVSAFDVHCVALALVIEYVSSELGIEYIAPAPAVTLSFPVNSYFLLTPRQPSLLTRTSTPPIWCTRNFLFLLLWLLNYRLLAQFLPSDEFDALVYKRIHLERIVTGMTIQNKWTSGGARTCGYFSSSCCGADSRNW